MEGEEKIVKSAPTVKILKALNRSTIYLNSPKIVHKVFSSRSLFSGFSLSNAIKFKNKFSPIMHQKCLSTISEIDVFELKS